MKLRNYIVLSISIIFIFCSCSSKKDIILFQDKDMSFVSKEYEYKAHILKPNDILKISITTEDPRASIQFNLMESNQISYNSTEVMKVNGYLINSRGYINFPVLGNLKVSGMTISELSNFIYNSLLENNQLKNHMVNIRLLNANFTVLGEVNNPGSYEFLEDNMNILKALGIAGDLTITGNRNDIKLIRETNNLKKVFRIDLTNINSLNSENYQIQSGDIIIVNPNNTRVKNAGIIGNSGTLISLLSFLLTSIIVIRN